MRGVVPVVELGERISVDQLLPGHPAEDDIEPSLGSGVDVKLARVEVGTLGAALTEDRSSRLRVAHDLHESTSQAGSMPLPNNVHRAGVAQELAQGGRWVRSAAESSRWMRSISVPEPMSVKIAAAGGRSAKRRPASSKS